MRRLPLLILPLLLAGCGFLPGFLRPHTPAKNPDPNHTHADFAVWIEDQQVNFARPEFMSGSSKDEHGEEHEHAHKHPYLHLHDGNGHVIHRHKPGLTFVDFLSSNLRLLMADDGTTVCLYTDSSEHPFSRCESGNLRLFINGEELFYGGDRIEAIIGYVFQDLDHLLLTDATDSQELEKELKTMTDDACLYSQTCPWRGPPPTENCIADPTVPCTAPLE